MGRTRSPGIPMDGPEMTTCSRCGGTAWTSPVGPFNVLCDECQRNDSEEEKKKEEKVIPSNRKEPTKTD